MKVAHTVSFSDLKPNVIVYRAEEGRLEAELRGAAEADWQRAEADYQRGELNT